MSRSTRSTQVNKYRKRKAASLIKRILQLIGEPVEIVKLTKLLYLCERAAIMGKGASITSDSLCSMDFGPVTSFMYDDLKETERNQYLHDFIERRGVYVTLTKAPDENKLSKYENELVEKIINRFGDYKEWDLVKYCHENIPEWEYPEGSSLPIEIESIMSQTEYPEEKKEVLLERMKVGSFLDSIAADL